MNEQATVRSAGPYIDCMVSCKLIQCSRNNHVNSYFCQLIFYLSNTQNPIKVGRPPVPPVCQWIRSNVVQRASHPNCRPFILATGLGYPHWIGCRRFCIQPIGVHVNDEGNKLLDKRRILCDSQRKSEFRFLISDQRFADLVFFCLFLGQ